MKKLHWLFWLAFAIGVTMGFDILFGLGVVAGVIALVIALMYGAATLGWKAITLAAHGTWCAAKAPFLWLGQLLGWYRNRPLTRWQKARQIFRDHAEMQDIIGQAPILPADKLQAMNGLQDDVLKRLHKDLWKESGYE